MATPANLSGIFALFLITNTTQHTLWSLPDSVLNAHSIKGQRDFKGNEGEGSEMIRDGTHLDLGAVQRSM